MIFHCQKIRFFPQYWHLRSCSLKFCEPVLNQIILSEPICFDDLVLILLQCLLIIDKTIHDPGFQCPSLHLIDLLFHHWNSNNSIAYPQYLIIFSLQNPGSLYLRPQQPLHSFEYTIWWMITHNLTLPRA